MYIRLLKIFIVILLAAGVAWAILLPGQEQVMGSYATSLEGRTPGQRHNAVLAARAVDGLVIRSGAVFSYNKTVGSWSADRGYVRAPVSYDGELQVDWGGGVCQSSTTLYNAALLAGLEIVERNRHNWAPKYVPTGRDAAVAQITIDLRLRNPYPYPVHIKARVSDSSIGFQIIGKARGPMARVETATVAMVPPSEVYKYDPTLAAGQRRTLTHGRPGVQVVLYRHFIHGPKAGRRELISQDAYPAMNKVVLVGQKAR